MRLRNADRTSSVRAALSFLGVVGVLPSPLLASDIALDETNDEVAVAVLYFSFLTYFWLQILVEMLWMTQAYMHDQRARLQQLVTVLNNSRG